MQILGLNYAPEPVGIGAYTRGLAEGLVRQGLPVRVISAAPYYPQWKIRALCRGKRRPATRFGAGRLGGTGKQPTRGLGIDALVRFTGFLGAAEVSRLMADALALVLVSSEEQWGLVVNEALSLGLPAIVSTAVGSRDELVRNLVNGFVIEPRSPEGIAYAMAMLAPDQSLWQRMSDASLAIAERGDAARMAQAVDCLFDPAHAPCTALPAPSAITRSASPDAAATP